MKRVLTIAGSDSSGGAGIQQDIKVFRALGVWGLSAVTSVTAQTSSAVRARFDMDADAVVAQIRTALLDGPIAAIKTGMLGTASIVEAVVRELEALDVAVVVDPVVSASDGAPLLDSSGLDAFRERLVPLAEVVCPNTAEAEVLTGIAVTGRDSQRSAAEALVARGARAAVVTGGHLPGNESVDVLVLANGTFVELPGIRVLTRTTHGTGCTFSAAVAGGLALGKGIEDAVRLAKSMVESGLRNGVELGGGGGALGV